MLIKAPESWPHPVVAVLAMRVLATLDLAGAAPFLLLFWVYASSLQFAELAPV